jgi:hypothetical protein
MQSLTRAARHSVLPGMNDTVRTMRLCGFLLLAACSGDPTLDIAVHHPEGYGVTQTSVTVYFGDDISCSEIEFDDRTDAELAAIAVVEVDVAKGERVEVSRLGGKSFVARGFDDQHRYVTAGCKDIGEITAGTKVKIDTQPTAVVAIDPEQPDLPFSARTILVNMSDINGVPLDGTVSWQLTGPAGAPEQPPSAGVATKNGDAKIRVDDLGTPGPEGLRIRVPWATTRLPLVTAFDLSHPIPIPLGGGSFGGHPSCDIRGHIGKPPTLVCLNQANVQGHRDVVELAWQTDHYAMTTIPIPAAIDNQFALFVDHDGNADESVYVISATGITGNWYKLGVGTVASPTFDSNSNLQNVVYVPRCEDNPFNPKTALVAVQTEAPVVGNKVQIFTPTGGFVVVPGGSTVPPQSGEVFSGGCVADVDKNEHQAIVVSDGSLDASAALVLVTPNPANRTIIQGSKLTGSGFVAAEAQGMLEKRFAGTRLQATGTVVFEAVLALENNNMYKLVERTEVEAAAPPAKIIGGKLDKDGDTDLMWDMGAGARRRAFQVSLAKRVGGVPLTAITSGPVGSNAATMADFIVGDLNGGKTDELVLFSAGAVTIYSADQ